MLKKKMSYKAQQEAKRQHSLMGSIWLPRNNHTRVVCVLPVPKYSPEDRVTLPLHEVTLTRGGLSSAGSTGQC